MKIGDEVYIHGYIDEIRKDTIIIKNDGGYFGTIPSEINRQETVTEFADRCRECGARYGRLLQQERKTGHWIYTLEDWNKWECSECGFTKRTDVHITLGYKYCPNCGAKMESEDE